MGDPAAELRLYRGLGRALALPGLRPTGMALRTQFIDDEVLRSLTAGVTQFVLVGAGYDGRGLRFSQPGVRWFEIDHPGTQPDKQRRVLEAASSAHGICFAAVDLLNDDVRTALGASGHTATRPSLFICEGLFAYLPNNLVAELCSRLHDLAAPGSALVASTLVMPTNRRGMTQAAVDAVLAVLGERRRGIFHPGTVEAALGEAGWTPRRQAVTPDGRLGGNRLLLVAAEST